MSANQQHVIQSQVFDVTLRERGLVHSVQETLSGLARGALLRETDEIFSRVADPERHVRIARLDLDLGTLSLDHLEEDFLAKYRPALWNALTSCLEQNPPAPADHEASGGTEIASSSSSMLEAWPGDEGPWFIDNAGLVMLAPFFPQFHRANDLLVGDHFREAAAAERGASLLRLLLGGEVKAGEHTLILNRVLCGLPPETLVPSGFQPRESEKRNVESLLESVRQNWPRAANLSLEGFRNSFLWREGKLERNESSWRLTVQTRGYDVLLVHLPWTFAVIKAAWMPEPLYVEWV